MKLAIINQTASTGGWKYISFLTQSLRKIDPQIEITLFIDILDKFSKPLVNELKSNNFIIKKLNYKQLPCKIFREKKKFHITFLDKIYNSHRKKRFDKKYGKSETHTLTDQLNDFDAVFYSWPFNLTAPDIKVPLFFIPHDFIFSHFFGFHSGHLYTRKWYLEQKERVQTFASKGAAIVSSQYVADEYKRICPESKPAHVVYLSKFNTSKLPSPKKCREILKKYDLPDKYILYANNWALHKNMQEVIGAYYQVKQKHPDVKLIITGYGTEGIYCQCNTPYYFDHVEYEKPYDVKSLGLIPEEDLPAVMKAAQMVINSSLCEAGSGSALDAWSVGTPIVMSNIPPFKQQVEFLQTKAEFFDPRNSDSIAAAMMKYLDNPQRAKEDAAISKQKLDEYSWDEVARRYLEIFKKGQS